MNPSRPPAHRPATRPRPAQDLPAIQARMLKKIRARKTPMKERVSLGISLLQLPAYAPEAERELSALAADPRCPPGMFGKISKALTSYEAGLTQKLKRERDQAAQRPIDFSGPATWAMLIDDDNAGLMDQWRAAHPEDFDKHIARELGVSTTAIRDWANTGARITKILRAAGVPRMTSFEESEAWWAEHENLRADLRADLRTALAPFAGQWSETNSA
jgi:hypothetical protein